MYITKIYKCLYIPFFKKYLKNNDCDRLRIRGTAITYGFIDDCNDVIMPYALNTFLSKLKKIGGFNLMPKMKYEHMDLAKLIGRWLNIVNTETSLNVEGVLYSSKIIQEVLSGKLQGLSIGFYAHDYEIRDDIRYLHEIELDEISLVHEPANPTAFCSPKDTIYYERSLDSECN